jgi:hypothetical protein
VLLLLAPGHGLLLRCVVLPLALADCTLLLLAVPAAAVVLAAVALLLHGSVASGTLAAAAAAGSAAAAATGTAATADAATDAVLSAATSELCDAPLTVDVGVSHASSVLELAHAAADAGSVTALPLTVLVAAVVLLAVVGEPV